jgi:hypothetical protein
MRASPVLSGGVFRRLGALLLLALGAGACTLEEITLVDAEDVIVAEVYVNVAQDTADNEIRAFLHRTIGAVDSVADLRMATVTVTRADGRVFPLTGRAVDDCVESSPVEDPGACFIVDDSTTQDIGAGDIYEVDIRLVDGGRITGATRVPGYFDLEDVPLACRLPPDSAMAVRWSRARDAWAYVNETSIRGLPDALRPEGIILDDDPLYLLGLSISDADTTITFPTEFGVFNRFDLDHDVAVRLQGGLPAGVTAEVSITAVDKNYVNWARGGNFNPSGQVRVASLRGDGTGVFGATVGRTFSVFASERPLSATPDCPGIVPGG